MLILWVWSMLHTELGVSEYGISPHSPVSNLRNSGLSWNAPAQNPPVAFHQAYARNDYGTRRTFSIWLLLFLPLLATAKENEMYFVLSLHFFNRALMFPKHLHIEIVMDTVFSMG